MVDWARWRHKYDIIAHTRRRHFLVGPKAADCAPTPLHDLTLALVECVTCIPTFVLSCLVACLQSIDVIISREGG